MIVFAGIAAYFTLPIAQYPEITPPTVEVSCSYPGASASVVQETIASPIEQEVNGVEKMLYMSSQCTNDGTYRLTITFELGTNLDMAQVLVQNRVALALPKLPDVVKTTGVSTKKKIPQYPARRQPVLRHQRGNRTAPLKSAFSEQLCDSADAG